MENKSGIVFNVQRFSLFDGPGVRTVVFLKGCSLSCIWCHNPEGLRKERQILYNPEKCICCGNCISACTNGCHFLNNDLHAYSRKNCIRCGACAEACPSEAITVAGEDMTVDQVMKRVLRDQTVYKATGGGMTLSGGEPLYQAEFSVALLRSAKEHGISTCLETSGYAREDDFLLATEYTDIFCFDYKATGDEAHRRLCGVSQEKILKNLRSLESRGARVILRCPIIPGVNDTFEHLEGIAAIAREMNCIKEVHLEPYHNLGVSKKMQLGESAGFQADPPEREQMEKYSAEIQRISGKQCVIS